MKKEKIIIVEGPQGAGKTTITDYLRNTLPYTNLYILIYYLTGLFFQKKHIADLDSKNIASQKVITNF